MQIGSLVKWNDFDPNGDSFECLGMVTYISAVRVAITWADGDENDYVLHMVKHKLELICE